jgi:hypothetical protein
VHAIVEGLVVHQREVRTVPLGNQELHALGARAIAERRAAAYHGCLGLEVSATEGDMPDSIDSIPLKLSNKPAHDSWIRLRHNLIIITIRSTSPNLAPKIRKTRSPPLIILPLRRGLKNSHVDFVVSLDSPMLASSTSEDS